MGTTRISRELEDELASLAGQQECELVHIAYLGGKLQIVLDRPDGVSLAHCESFARQASALLDVEDFGADRYTLEVSSPGLDRQLYRPADYERFRGRRVKMTFFEGEQRRKRTVVGELQRFDKDAGGIATLVEPSGVEHHVPLADVKVARLVLEL